MSVGRGLALRILLAAIPLLIVGEGFRRSMLRRAEVERLVQYALAHLETHGLAELESAPQRFGGPVFAQSSAEARDRPGGPERVPGHERMGQGERVPPDRSLNPDRGGARPERGAPGERGGMRHGRPPPPTPVQVWAYDAEFRSANPRAPPFPETLKETLGRGAEVAHEQTVSDDREILGAGIRTPWPGGQGAFLLALRRGPSTVAPGRVEPEQELLLQAGVLAAVLVLAALFAAWPLVRRVRRLTAAVQRSAADGYVSQLPVQGRDELASLAAAFNSAGGRIRQTIDTLEQRAEALRAFLSNTTHDVMTPLTVLQGHLGTMRRKAALGEPLGTEVIAAAQEEAHYVASLVHNLTAAARLESGVVPVRRDAVDLRGVTERAVSRHRPMAESRRVSLEFGVPGEAVLVVGDVTLLEQAVSNLVHNAVRYNLADRHVAVVLESHDGAFSLRVVDDGPGVDDAQLARLTDRRFRTDAARQRDPDGQGLGLAIVREVVERHGFSLALRQRPEGGFEAVVAGPLHEPADASETRKADAG